MAIKREYEVGDVAFLTNNKRVPKIGIVKADVEGTPMVITGYTKIEEKAGAYLYSVEFINPKTKEPVKLEEWFTQFDFMTKDMIKKSVANNEMMKKLERLEKERQVQRMFK